MDSNNQTGTFDTSTGEALAAQSSASGVVIDYDASGDAYTITSNGGRSATFSASDEVAGGQPGGRLFERTDGNRTERLILAYENFGPRLETESVALGVWQSSLTSGSNQDDEFEVFVYGFPTDAAAVPVTGTAEYRTGLYGYTSQVGEQAISFEGSGNLIFDFGRGTFILDAGIKEDFRFTNDGRTGALYFRASGTLSSSLNGFTGTFLYDGSGRNTIVGLINGLFFGGDASEAGGTFAGDDGAGNSVIGGFTAEFSGDPTRNISLEDLQFDERFFLGQSRYRQQRFKDGSPGTYEAGITTNGSLRYTVTDQNFRLSGYVENEGRFGPDDIVSAQGAEFEVYERTVGPEVIQLALFQPTNASGVDLTYSSFGTYRRTYEDSVRITFTETWFHYGLPTLEGVLDGRTGTASYNGIARGIAGSSDGLRDLDVTGTSQFVINFADQGYSGWLRLSGTEDGGSTVDFGQFDLLAGNGFSQNFVLAPLQQGGADVGRIQLRFYGPNGEELTGIFSILTSDYAIAGATGTTRD